MFHALEARRLFAATATLADGTLTVVGTDQSERIAVTYGLLPATTFGTGGGRYTPLVVVRVDGELLGRFKAGAVNDIHVLANGGNDRVTGPISPLATLPTGGGSVVGVAIEGEPMLIDGGSGRDRLVGGIGDDTLLGGRGNDHLYDPYGRNRLDGGTGNDVVNAVDESSHARNALTSLGGSTTRTIGRSAYTRFSGNAMASPDTLIGGPGADRVSKDADDDASGFEQSIVLIGTGTDAIARATATGNGDTVTSLTGRSGDAVITLVGRIG